MSSSDNAETWRTLYDATWVDFGTRLVSLDFTIYNPSIDMLIWGTHVTEFMPSGDVIPTFHYRIFDEWKYLRVWRGEDVDATTWTLLVVEMLMYLYAATYLWEEISEMFYWGPKNYFSSILTWRSCSTSSSSSMLPSSATSPLRNLGRSKRPSAMTTPSSTSGVLERTPKWP